LATQHVTFLSALPLGWRHGALGKLESLPPTKKRRIGFVIDDD